MASQKVKVKVGKRTLELTNLDRILFPDDGITKAEIIAYYNEVAATMLRHIKGRPLSFVRVPDGIKGQRFFQKNKQDWAPEWIESVPLGNDEKTNYIVATEPASLVWLANLACVEFHQMPSRAPLYEKSDYMVFDLDPPEKAQFKSIVTIAVELRHFLESLGYFPFTKTSGNKGVHVVVPLEPDGNCDVVRDAAVAIAKEFIRAFPEETTLEIRKDQRKGKIFVDVFRNSHSQTIVSPYSVRASPGAPISTPVTWERLVAMKSPDEFSVKTVLAYLKEEGDPWSAIGAYASKLHSAPNRKVRAAAPASLKEYEKKRDFKKTPEPAPARPSAKGNAFVIHRHHASRLHYDLRLEIDGALRSWAVPKGLPSRPGIKHLAVAVEDHPIEYLTFEGEIPKGEYGAGHMWVFATGRFEVSKQKKDDFYFRLHSEQISAEYHLIHTSENQWLVERIDSPQVDYLSEWIGPMLAESRDKPFDSPDYLYELKLDGIRAQIRLEQGQITVRSRSGEDISTRFPELLDASPLNATSAVFDGEIVCLDAEGLPVFSKVISRLQKRQDLAIAQGRKQSPAVCYLFDCIHLDGRDIINEPLERRRAWLSDLLKPANGAYRLSRSFEGGEDLYRAVVARGLEGIVAKKLSGKYTPGRRSANWLKIKARKTIDCVIIGYTEGKGDLQGLFGALHLAVYREGALSYIGKVGSGFDGASRASLMKQLKKLTVDKKPIKETVPESADSTWVKPELVCEVSYASKPMYLREPVFVRLRPEKTLEDCVE